MRAIRWGILGTGAVAGLFAEGLGFADGSRLQAVASRDGAKADRFGRRFGAARAYASYAELVGDVDVDVVYVATPNERHVHDALLALEAGKPVLCEKPFALDAEEARRIIETARRRRLFCMEAMWTRFSPAVQEAFALVRDGALGEIRLVSAQLGFPFVPAAGDKLFQPPGGGALLDLGVYPLSLVHALLGAPARVRVSIRKAASGVDEQVSAVLECTGGAQALVAASLRARLSNDASIHGTAGVLRLHEPLWFPHRYTFARTPPHGAMREGRRGFLARLRRHRAVQALAELRARARVRSVVRRTNGHGYEQEANEVTRCLRAGAVESPTMPLDHSLAVLQTVDAMRTASTSE